MFIHTVIITGNSTRADVDMTAQHRISNITQVVDFAAFSNDIVLPQVWRVRVCCVL